MVGVGEDSPTEQNYHKNIFLSKHRGAAGVGEDHAENNEDGDPAPDVLDDGFGALMK